jgi:hypothetical protein
MPGRRSGSSKNAGTEPARGKSRRAELVKPETMANTDPEFERALLGVLLADNRAFDQIGQLEPDDLSAGYAVLPAASRSGVRARLMRT